MFRFEQFESDLAAHGIACRLHEPMRLHTTFRIGGEADCFVMPSTEEEIAWLCRTCREREIPLFLMGNGSNLLVADEGVRGCVLSLGKNFSKIEASGDTLTAQSGALLSVLSRTAADHALTGLEFASGIPGTVGGAVFMNAGAYGGELCDVTVAVRVLNALTGVISEIPAADAGFAYRTSRFQQEPDTVILGAQFRLSRGETASIRETMAGYAAGRREKQPLEFPSAGSTFKRPNGMFAAAMIDTCGLKGVSVGAAQVSMKHAGFLVNRGGATARDMRALISLVQARVFDRYGVQLEPEIRFVGGYDETE
jgi:UDP-N-acetylmuramate dehydrogenase